MGDILFMWNIRILIIVGNWNWVIWRQWEFSRVLSVIIFLGCFTKSAQIPFSAWLPAAIAAPTPVSSLVHSSTLVTAGIYVLFRFSSILMFSGVEFFGILTLIIAGLNALKEIDIKKVVALSTLRQLGLIVRRLGRGFFLLRFYHLILHAFFKALLFIRVGNMIHFSDDFQDLRKINFYGSFSSLTLTFSIIANFSLIGFPFLTGFFSKDLILENFFLGNIFYIGYWIFFWFGCVLTRVYRCRFIYIVVFSLHLRKRQIWKYWEDWNFILGGRILWMFRVFAGSRLFWLFQDFKEVIIFSFRIKILINLILVRGILFFILLNFSNFFKLKRWNFFFIWRLPQFSKAMFKKEIFERYFYLNFIRDQFLNKEVMVLRDKILGRFKMMVFKKYFFFWKIIFVLCLLILF